MSDYIIATSSTSDLPRTWLDAHSIPFIPYGYTVNDTADGCTVTFAERGQREILTKCIHHFSLFTSHSSLVKHLSGIRILLHRIRLHRNRLHRNRLHSRRSRQSYA